MKRRNLWILLAALAVVGIVVLALLGLLGGKEDAKPVDGDTKEEAETVDVTATPEPTPVDPELPMDESPLAPVEEGSEEESGETGDQGEEPVPGNEDPAETTNPEEDSRFKPSADKLAGTSRLQSREVFCGKKNFCCHKKVYIKNTRNERNVIFLYLTRKTNWCIFQHVA